jgi:hypothetical protein
LGGEGIEKKRIKLSRGGERRKERGGGKSDIRKERVGKSDGRKERGEGVGNTLED